MHSTDQFNDLGFRLANLAAAAPPAIPAHPVPALQLLPLGLALAGGVALRTQRRYSAR
jgi:hypothetical protein